MSSREAQGSTPPSWRKVPRNPLARWISEHAIVATLIGLVPFCWTGFVTPAAAVIWVVASQDNATWLVDNMPPIMKVQMKLLVVGSLALGTLAGSLLALGFALTSVKAVMSLLGRRFRGFR
jgi:hypothetical protein